jgi:hypothetical protein
VDELAAARKALERRGRDFVVHRTLNEGVADALERTRAGDLILLIGAQGMNQGRRMLLSSAGISART